MPPKTSAKNVGKPSTKTPNQAVGGIIKRQTIPTTNTNTASKVKALTTVDLSQLSRNASELVDDVQSLTEAATMPATAPASAGAQAELSTAASLATELASARDKVIQTPELLENILRFTGYQTLLTSILRVDKHFNAIVTASPCLQKVMFESFTSLVPGQPSPSTHILVNEALSKRFSFPGTTASLVLRGHYGSSLASQSHHEKRYLQVAFNPYRVSRVDSEKSNAPARSWRKLRVFLHQDCSQKCQTMVSSYNKMGGLVLWVYDKFPADLTLGELYDWLTGIGGEVPETMPGLVLNSLFS